MVVVRNLICFWVFFGTLFVCKVWELYAPLTEWYMNQFFLSMCNTNVHKWAQWKWMKKPIELIT